MEDLKSYALFFIQTVRYQKWLEWIQIIVNSLQNNFLFSMSYLTIK
jgi:uncharacterized protein YqcC (DUF446 family)